MAIAAGVRASVVTALVGAAGPLAGCSKPTTAPPLLDRLPPSVIETYPAARATRVPYETIVWARFREPLDSTSVTPTTVFLKIDTRRIPMTIALEDSARKLVIRPVHDLELNRTYTVEITPKVRDASGASFANTFFWQFTSSTVRMPAHPEPADGTIDESPVAPLFWDETEAGAGPAEYRVFHGLDSAQVASETVLPLTIETPHLLPFATWERGARVYWKIRARNKQTGEEAVGPVWRFDVTPPGIPTDSIHVPLLDSGSWDGQFNVWRCPNILSGPRAGGVVRFDLDRIDSTLTITDAAIVLAPSAPPLPTHNLQIWSLTRDLMPCDQRFLGYPASAAFLASGVGDPTGRARYASAPLAAHVLARIRRHREFHGYGVRSGVALVYNHADPGCGVRITFLRRGSTPAQRPGSAR